MFHTTSGLSQRLFCWRPIFTEYLLRPFSIGNLSVISGKSISSSIIPVSNRWFSTSQTISARGNRLRQADQTIMDDYDEADINPLISDSPDMKGRRATPALIERLGKEGPNNLKELFEESTNLSEEKSGEKWASSPYPPLQQEFKRERDQSKKVSRPRIDQKQTSIVLFPGQGSQFVGMGGKLLDYPNVPEIYDVAAEILGYDLLKMCLHGPQEELDKTVYSQTAIYVTSIAALEKLKADHLMAVESCAATAGFSVGEYAALVFAGSLSFEDGLRLVKARAEAMQSASEAVLGGMMTVLIEHDSNLGKAMDMAKLWCRDKKGIRFPVCKIANYLFPEGKVIAGHIEALDFIEANAHQFKLRPLKRLAVSGAFHTPLMTPAKEQFFGHISNVKFKVPTIKTHHNLRGVAYNNASSITRFLLNQIDSPIRWEQTLHIMYERKQGTDFPWTYEVGPGRQLGSILKRNNAKAFAFYTAIDV